MTMGSGLLFSRLKEKVVVGLAKDKPHHAYDVAQIYDNHSELKSLQNIGEDQYLLDIIQVLIFLIRQLTMCLNHYFQLAIIIFLHRFNHKSDIKHFKSLDHPNSLNQIKESIPMVCE
jgi:hypothetical protein